MEILTGGFIHFKYGVQSPIEGPRSMDFANLYNKFRDIQDDGNIILNNELKNIFVKSLEYINLFLEESEIKKYLILFYTRQSNEKLKQNKVNFENINRFDSLNEDDVKFFSELKDMLASEDITVATYIDKILEKADYYPTLMDKILEQQQNLKSKDRLYIRDLSNLKKIIKNILESISLYYFSKNICKNMNKKNALLKICKEFISASNYTPERFYNDFFKDMDASTIQKIKGKKKDLFIKILGAINLIAPTTDNFFSLRNNSFNFFSGSNDYTTIILREIPHSSDLEEIYRNGNSADKCLLFTIKTDFKIFVKIVDKTPPKNFDLNDLILQESLHPRFKLCNTGTISGNKKKYYNMLSRKVKKINIEGGVTEEYLMPHTKNILNIFYDTIDLTSLDINISYKENIIKSHIMGGSYGYISRFLFNTNNGSKTSSVSFEKFEDYKKNIYFKELNKIFKRIIDNVNKIVSNKSSSMNYIDKINHTYNQFINLFEEDLFNEEEERKKEESKEAKYKFIIEYFNYQFNKIKDSELKEAILNMLENINIKYWISDNVITSSIYFHNFSKISREYTYNSSNLKNDDFVLDDKLIKNINTKISEPIENVSIELLIGTIFWCLYINQIRLYENSEIMYLLDQYFFDLATDPKNIFYMKKFLFKTINVQIKTITKNELLTHKKHDSEYNDSFKYYNYHTNLLSSFEIPDQGRIYHQGKGIPDCGEITTLTLLSLFCYDFQSNTFKTELLPDSTDKLYKDFFKNNNNFSSIYTPGINSEREKIQKSFWKKKDINYFKSSNLNGPKDIEIIPLIDNIFNLIIVHIFNINSISNTDTIEDKITKLFEILNTIRKKNNLPSFNYELNNYGRASTLSFPELFIEFEFSEGHGRYHLDLPPIKKINNIDVNLNGINKRFINLPLNKKNEYNGLYFFFTYINKCKISFHELFNIDNKILFSDKQIFDVIKNLRIYEDIHIINHKDFNSIFSRKRLTNTDNLYQFLTAENRILLTKEVLSSAGYEYYVHFINLVKKYYSLNSITKYPAKMTSFKQLLTFLKNKCFFNITTLIKIFQFDEKTFPKTVDHVISSFDLVFFANKLQPFNLPISSEYTRVNEELIRVSINNEDYRVYKNFIRISYNIEINNKLHLIKNINQGPRTTNINILYKSDRKFNTIKIGNFNLFNFVRNSHFVLDRLITGIDILAPSIKQILKDRGYFQKIIDFISESVTKLPNFTKENIGDLYSIILNWSNILYDTIIYEYFADLVNKFRFYFIRILNYSYTRNFFTDYNINIIKFVLKLGFFLFPVRHMFITDQDILAEIKTDIEKFRKIPYKEIINFNKFRNNKIKNNFTFFLGNFPNEIIHLGYNSYNIPSLFENIMMGYTSGHDINSKIKILTESGSNNYSRKYIRGYLILLVYITKYIADNDVDIPVINNLITMIVGLVGCFIKYERIIIETQDLDKSFLKKISPILKKLVKNIKQIIKKDISFFIKMREKFDYDKLSVFLLLFTDKSLFDTLKCFYDDINELVKSIDKHSKFIISNESRKVERVIKENLGSEKSSDSKYLIDNTYKSKYIKYKKKYLKLKDILKN